MASTALAFGFVLLALAYTLGPISGAHVNLAVTLGFVVSGRMTLGEAVGYWVAQFVGGILGALVLWGIVSWAPGYSRSATGLGADGWGHGVSMVGIGAGGAFATEIVLTFVFVLVVLVATSRVGSPGFAGLAIGLALTVVHLIGIPLTGTSVNPARSLGPAIIVAHKALSQVWLFIVAPLPPVVRAMKRLGRCPSRFRGLRQPLFSLDDEGDPASRSRGLVSDPRGVLAEAPYRAGGEDRQPD